MKFTSSILFILCHTIAFAQLSVDWTFTNNAAYNYYPTTNIVRHGDHTYISSQSIDADNSAYVFRLDDTGMITHSDSIHHFTYSFLEEKRMAMDINGNIYLCGNFSGLAIPKIRLIKYDSLLNRLWDVVIDDTSSFQYEADGILYSPTDSSVYIIGWFYDTLTHSMIKKVNHDGNSSWTWLSNAVNMDIVDYDLDHSGAVVIGGYTTGMGSGEDMSLSRIDASGNLSWTQTFDGSGGDDDALRDIVITQQNLIGTVNRFEDSIQIKLMLFDTTGNLKWTGNVGDFYLPRITSDASGALYTVSFGVDPNYECVVHKYDSTGNFIHCDSIDLPGFLPYPDYFESFITDDSANVYILANVYLGMQTRWFFAKYDSSLTLKTVFVYTDTIPNPSTASSLALTDEGFIIAGAINNYSELRVVHFNENFPTGIPERLMNDLISWPNPVHDRLHLMLKPDMEGIDELSLYDVNGRELYSFGKITGNHCSIDVSDLSPGIYFFNYSYGNNIGQGRFIKK